MACGRCGWVLFMIGVAVFDCNAEPVREVTIGSKKFTESVILGEMAKYLIEDAGTPARHRAEIGGTRVLWEALQLGEIDAYPEYTGTIIEEILAGESVSDHAALRAKLAERGMSMTAPLGFDNTYAIGVKRSLAKRLTLRKVSDLRERPKLRFGFGNEFLNRADGWPGLRDRYRLPQQDVRGMDHDLAYQALDSDSIDVIDLYSTDADIKKYDLVALEDDLNYFPKYQALFVYRTDLQARAPDAVDAIERLAGRISDEQMLAMNARVKIDHVAEAEVAADFLDESLGIQSNVHVATTPERIWLHTREHLLLVAVSLLAAILVAIPLGILAAKAPAFGHVVLSAVSVIQTIPGLALLVMLIPLLGIGFWPTVVALFLYSLLPIVRNTHAGLTGITPSLLEAATALGLSPTARLLRIEIPLASPTILAGIKTAAVINVGLATLGALIGAGGYGQPILTGIRLMDYWLIAEGAIPAALLALAVQGGFELIERLVVPAGLRLRKTG